MTRLGGGWGNRLGGQGKHKLPRPSQRHRKGYGRFYIAGKLHVYLLCMGEKTGALWLI